MARYVTVDRDTYRSMLSLQHDDGREHVGLIGSSDRRTLDRFAEDRQCIAEPNECRLSEEACTVFHEWQHSRVRFAGLMHTHPEGRNKLSPSDMAYAQELMRLNGMACMLMGILTREELCMYLVHVDGETEALEYMIC